MSGKPIDGVVQALIEVAVGKVQHLYRGTCPDAIEGFDSRDQQCPACRVLIAVQQDGGDGCHCGTCTCNPNMTPAVRFDLSPAQKEGAIRDHLIALGWTPPGAHQTAAVDEAVRLLREYRKAPKFSNDHDAIKRTVALEDEIDSFLAALAIQPGGSDNDR